MGFPDYSKVKTILPWEDNIYSRDVYRNWPNPTFAGRGPYVVPEDGWIIVAVTSEHHRGKDNDVDIYLNYWYVNGAQVHGEPPFLVKKGDTVSSYNEYYENYNDLAFIYAPNRK